MNVLIYANNKEAKKLRKECSYDDIRINRYHPSFDIGSSLTQNIRSTTRPTQTKCFKLQSDNTQRIKEVVKRWRTEICI